MLVVSMNPKSVKTWGTLGALKTLRTLGMWVLRGDCTDSGVLTSLGDCDGFGQSSFTRNYAPWLNLFEKPPS